MSDYEEHKRHMRRAIAIAEAFPTALGKLIEARKALREGRRLVQVTEGSRDVADRQGPMIFDVTVDELLHAAQDRLRELGEAIERRRQADEWAVYDGDAVIAALRAQLAERDATIAVMREALKLAEYDLGVAASYVGLPGMNAGLRIHALACERDLDAVERALSSNAGKRHAERVAALERVAVAARRAKPWMGPEVELALAELEEKP